MPGLCRLEDPNFQTFGRFLLRVLRKVPPKNSSNISISGRGVHVVVVKKTPLVLQNEFG